MLFEIRDNGDVREAKAVRISDEARELRDLLAHNPFLLPGDQIDPESPRRWLVVRKEMPVPDPGGGGSRWSVDVLLCDQAGVPTFVECKRFADTRARREVVGQMLEYAANGHFYWNRAELESYVEATAATQGKSTEDLLAELDPEDADSLEELLDQFVEKLREGQVRLVFFMENAPQELKSIVDFLNRQTERTEVLLVEARVYEADGKRLVSPALFGYTEEARRAKRSVTVSAGERRKKWTAEAFFVDARENLDEEQVAVLQEGLSLGREFGCRISWGTGTRRGSFSLIAQERCRRSFVSFLSDGELWVNLGWLSGSEEADAFRERVLTTFRDEVKLDPKGSKSGFWTFRIEEWFPRKDAVLAAIRTLLEETAEDAV